MAARLQAFLDHLSGVTPNGVVADSILATILVLGLPGAIASAADLKTDLAGVTNDSARLLLERLATIIHNVHEKSGPVFREAYYRAFAGAEAIEGFTKEHQVFRLIVAIGVLYILTPYAVKLLGFMPEGPALASFAAKWQSNYGGDVPAKSLFAYLQHLGMTMAA